MIIADMGVKYGGVYRRGRWTGMLLAQVWSLFSYYCRIVVLSFKQTPFQHVLFCSSEMNVIGQLNFLGKEELRVAGLGFLL